MNSCSSAMTPPTTPSTAGQRSHNININQKLDLMLMEQKKTVEDTKTTADELQKQVVSLSSDLAEMKNKVESVSRTPSAGGVRKKIPPQLSVGILVIEFQPFCYFFPLPSSDVCQRESSCRFAI